MDLTDPLRQRDRDRVERQTERLEGTDGRAPRREWDERATQGRSRDVRSLGSVIRHDARLDLLGNLVYGGPCKAAELSKRIGVGIRGVDYHLAVLLSQHLVAKKEGDLHVATLEDHPAWVEEAVTAYQLAKRISLRLPSSAMHGLKCDQCERLIRCEQQIVAVYYEKNGALRARVVTEGVRRPGEENELGATSKYHTACYGKARRGSAPLPPVEPER